MITLFIFGALILLTGLTVEPIMWILVAAGLVCIAAGMLLLTVFRFRKVAAEISEEAKELGTDHGDLHPKHRRQSPGADRV